MLVLLGMNAPPHIVWKGFPVSPALEAAVHAELAQLDALFPRITACRVVLDQPHRHHRHGRHFGVKVELTVPGKVLVASRDPVDHDTALDPYVALSEAFAAVRRQLDDYRHIQQGRVKHHPGDVEHHPPSRRPPDSPH